VLHFCHIGDAAAKAVILTKESNDESDEIWKRRGCGEKEKGPIRIGPKQWPSRWLDDERRWIPSGRFGNILITETIFSSHIILLSIVMRFFNHSGPRNTRNIHNQELGSFGESDHLMATRETVVAFFEGAINSDSHERLEPNPKWRRRDRPPTRSSS
jgi:hypothetical protein